MLDGFIVTDEKTKSRLKVHFIIKNLKPRKY